MVNTGLSCSKKAEASEELSLRHIIHITLAFLAIILLTAVYMNSYSEQSIEKETLAVKTALLLDTISSADGDLYVRSQDFFDNSLHLEKNKVSVPDVVPYSHYFLLPSHMDLEQDEFSPENNDLSLEFQKIGNGIFAGKDLEYGISMLSCPYIRVEEPADIIIMPKTISGKSFFFTESLVNDMDRFHKDVSSADKIDKKPNMILVLDFHQEPVLKAEIPEDSAKSRRLACMILENLHQGPDTMPEIIISEEPFFDNADKVVRLTLPESLKHASTAKKISDSIEKTIS